MGQARVRPNLRLVLGDQLSPGLSALRDARPGDVVLLAEVMAECSYVPHHAHKIVLVLSAMRHFAAGLRGSGLVVDHVALDDPDNSQSLRGEVLRAAARHGAQRIVATAPGEWRVLRDMQGWQDSAGCPVEIRADDRFLCDIDEFAGWAAGRRGLRMEFFYRDMRRRHDLLMEEGGPVGGQWNFDHDNRKRLPPDILPPAVPGFEPDGVTAAVIALVAARFPDNIGDPRGFALPVTAAQAEAALADFLAHRLA